ncbi:SRA stem-loop-interacting RNA-binding protein, mitochondrial [Alligator mississippiensis]|uniref:SRA stem-loop-interacting RNA-binding protein, mitochondrial n=1 Tax=Alligator mississippiensis TaxID=8496 RepID=A0A151M5H6_ALLMI|nr:SRA stem-loop-interacting RNA-binding protein, mitochondrial [Alligator mississippiensis]KYO19775.1 SRA stem-loop-interacting RNA-binding protein, mitochondrial [Alligator mississippiensis]
MAPQRRLYVLFVRKLPWTVARDEIWQYFSKFGYLKKCSLPFDETGFHKGYCWIYLDSQSSMDNVLKNSHTLEGAQLQILKSF